MNAEAKTVDRPRSLVVRTGERFGVEPEKLLGTLKATCFRGDVSTEQMMALLVVADQYKLNPFTKEIYAFPDSRNGIVPIVGVDGWSRIINENAAFDGMDFKDGPLDEKGVPEWIECAIHRKDRAHPISVREYFKECVRKTPAWESHPRRMLRHKAMIQCARMAMGYVGLYDPDEGEAIVAASQPDLGPRTDIREIDPTVCDRWIGQITDLLSQDKEEAEIATDLRAADAELSRFPELAQSVFDGLAARGIIKKGKYREYLKIGL